MTAPPASAHRDALVGYTDPGSIAVARGLAHRDPDGSVVFDLSPEPLSPDPMPGYHEPAVWLTTIARSPETVQRQEMTEPADAPDHEPASTTPATGSAVPSATAGATVPTQAPVTAGPASTPPAAAGGATPPLDELARQLFGPLTAHLKAELRLDRERAGLLTDLRQ